MNDFLSIEDIAHAGKVVTLDKVQKVLEYTEPLEEHIITTNHKADAVVSMPDQWNVGLKELDDSTLTVCTIEHQGKKYDISKSAMLTLLSRIGISDRYAYKTPGSLLETHVNYWLTHEGVGSDIDLKMITKDTHVVGFMSPYNSILSNLELLRHINQWFKDNGYGKQVYVDPKIFNNYVHTEFRIIVGKDNFEVETVRNDEVVRDRWFLGLRFQNSLMSYPGKSLTLSGYMMEQNSLAGILPDYSNLASYARSGRNDTEDLRGWVRSTLDQIFSVLPAEAEMVKHMPQHSLDGKIGAVTTDLFYSMKIHRKVQAIALENLTLTGDMTSYGLMHALASSVSNPGVKFAPKIVGHVQQVGGTLPSRMEEICGSCGRLHMFD